MLLWNSQICYRVGATITPYTIIREAMASNRDREIRYPRIHHANSTTEPLSWHDLIFGILYISLLIIHPGIRRAVFMILKTP